MTRTTLAVEGLLRVLDRLLGRRCPVLWRWRLLRLMPDRPAPLTEWLRKARLP